MRAPLPAARRGARAAARLLLLAVVGAPAACGGHAFHAHYEARRWADAARAYEADPSLADDPRARYRAALLHAVPGRPSYDPARALAELEELRLRHAGSEYADRALPLVATLRQVVRMREESARRETRTRALVAAVDSLRASNEGLRHRLDEAEDRVDLMLALAERLEAELRERERRVRELEAELERLKTIDLSPGDTVAAAEPPLEDGGD